MGVYLIPPLKKGEQGDLIVAGGFFGSGCPTDWPCSEFSCVLHPPCPEIRLLQSLVWGSFSTLLSGLGAGLGAFSSFGVRLACCCAGTRPAGGGLWPRAL